MQIRRPLCLFAAMFTLFVFLTGLIPQKEKAPPAAEGETILIAGKVSSREQKNESYTYDLAEVSIFRSRADSAELPKIIQSKGKLKVLATTETEEVLCLGERVVLSARVSLFAAAQNEGEFDEAAYYGRKGYAFKTYRAKVLLRDKRANTLLETMQRWKEDTTGFYESVLGQASGSVLAAMVLGERKGMDKEIRDLYRQNGIAHILAISGLHISLLGLMCYKLMRRAGIPLVICTFAGMGFILFYGILTGGGSSVVRASVMLSMQIFADLINRSYDLLTAMAVSGLLLLTVFPQFLSDAGFLLSFLAVFGIALVTPALEERGKKLAQVIPVLRRLTVWMELSQMKTATESGRGKGTKNEKRDRKGNDKRRSERRRRIWKSKGVRFLSTMLAKGYEAVLISLGVFLATLPVLLWYYYEFAPYSIILNLLLVPLMGIVLVSGIVGAVFRIGILLAPAGAVLRLYEIVCRCFASLPHHLIRTGRPSVLKVVIYYLVLVVLVFATPVLEWIRNKICTDEYRMISVAGMMGKIRELSSKEQIKTERSCEDQITEERNDHKKVFCPCREFVLLAAFVFLLTGAKQENRLDMLSIGQGDCVILQDDNGHVVISDGGSSDNKQAGTYRLLPFLKYHGISHIDAVYLSHPHADHYSALIELFESSREQGFRIDALFVSKFAESDQEYGAVIDSAKKAGIRIAVLKPGQRQDFGKISLLMLYPDGTEASDDVNDQSMVLYGKVDRLSVLLTGDATSETDDALVRALSASDIKHVDCYKAEHHGSGMANSKRMLTFLHPTTAIISCGENNVYGHPHKETLERLRECGCRYLITSECGQITLRTDEKGFAVTSFLDR